MITTKLSEKTPEERTEYWNNYSRKHLLNKKIIEVRYLTDEEKEMLGWYGRALILILEDGTLIFPSTDDEGNDAGALLGQTPKSDNLTFPIL